MSDHIKLSINDEVVYDSQSTSTTHIESKPDTRYDAALQNGLMWVLTWFKQSSQDGAGQPKPTGELPAWWKWSEWNSRCKDEDRYYGPGSNLEAPAVPVGTEPTTGTGSRISGHQLLRGHPVENQHVAGLTQCYTFEIEDGPRQVEVMYEVVGGSDSGVKVVSYLTDDAGVLFLAADERVLANSQNFPVVLENGHYKFYVTTNAPTPLGVTYN